MAQFEGTIKEFMRFIGPYARIKVMQITQKYRRSIGECEECKSDAKLEAAHVKGKERPKIISDILNNFIEDSIIKIDLREFEDLFIKAHSPIEKTIKILCVDCHRKYDKSENISDYIPEEQDDLELEKVEIIETQIVSNLVHNSVMNKTKAINHIIKEIHADLNFRNTIFSNPGSSLDLWWLEPSNDKFNSGFYFILNNAEKHKLLLFKIPQGAIENPKAEFRQREDKGVSQIIIPISETHYVDRKGFKFDSFLINEIEY